MSVEWRALQACSALGGRRGKSVKVQIECNDPEVSHLKTDAVTAAMRLGKKCSGRSSSKDKIGRHWDSAAATTLSRCL